MSKYKRKDARQHECTKVTLVLPCFSSLVWSTDRRSSDGSEDDAARVGRDRDGARGVPPGESTSSPYVRTVGAGVHVVTKIHFADEHTLKRSYQQLGHITPRDTDWMTVRDVERDVDQRVTVRT